MENYTKNHMEYNNESYFDGMLIQLIGWQILSIIITIISFGILFPWAFCLICRWEAKHTVIGGYRLEFDGTAMQLIGNWIKWLIFTILTLGIYGFWVNLRLKQWKIKHTHFAN